MGTKGKFKYSIESIRLEALKYNSRVDFMRKASGFYQSAARQNILDEVCSHMKLHHKTAWGKEEIEK